MTDAKLGHVQEMLESIPYLDCCERQQRSFGCFLWCKKLRSGVGLMVVKGKFQVGGGQLMVPFNFDTVLQKRVALSHDLHGF